MNEDSATIHRVLRVPINTWNDGSTVRTPVLDPDVAGNVSTVRVWLRSHTMSSRRGRNGQQQVEGVVQSTGIMPVRMRM